MDNLERRISIAHQHILTRKQFLQSYSSDGAALRGVKVLDRYQVFDAFTQTGEECMTYASKKLPIITILGAYTHFAGSLGVFAFNQEGSPSRFIASLGKGREKQSALLECFHQQLGLTFLGEKKRNMFSTHGSSYARLLYLLSFSTSLAPSSEHRSTKSEREALLPHYLTKLAYEYETFDIKGQRLALQYLRDVMAVFVDTSASTSVADSTIRLNLSLHPHESTVRTEAAFLMKSFMLAYSSLSLTDENLHIFPSKPHDMIKYQGYFTFNASQIFKASLANPLFPARVRIIPKPFFSFQYMPKNSASRNNNMTSRVT